MNCDPDACNVLFPNHAQIFEDEDEDEDEAMGEKDVLMAGKGTPGLRRSGLGFEPSKWLGQSLAKGLAPLGLCCFSRKMKLPRVHIEYDDPP
jgi:hypothetical protein